MASLILEGGTFRPIFSSGIMDAFIDEGIELSYVIGVSAGIIDGFSYVSKQKKRNYDILMNFRHDKRYVGIKNYLTDKSLFGLQFAYETVSNDIYPFDYDTFLKSPTIVKVGVTNAKTGKSEYLDGKQLDKKCTMLKATCAIPFVFPAIHLNGNEYYDGGICDPIPIRKAIEDGQQKHIIILTRDANYQKTLSKANVFASKVLKKKYPLMVQPLLNRHIAYNETIQFCEQLEKEGKAIIFRPTKDINIQSFEKDLDKIDKLYHYGYQLAMERIDEVKEFIKK